MNREELISFYQTKTYIGDSVYVHFDGYHFILETINGYPDDPRNRIGLEPYVFDKLIQHRKNCYQDFEKLKETEANQ